MPERITAPGPTARQLSGQLPGQGWFLSVLARRTYQLDLRSGRCRLAAEQLPLQEKVLLNPETEETLADADLVHWKPLSDIVVRGHVRVRSPEQETLAGIRLGVHRKQLVAVGARRAATSNLGRVLFSDPEPFTEIPLSFEFAYGGRDQTAEAVRGLPGASLPAGFLPPGTTAKDLSPFVYPRNPAGRGFLIDASRAAVEAVRLPQLEDPEDRLTPERLPAGDPMRWPEMPVAQSLGWISISWFPRVGYLGVVPMHVPPRRPYFEIAKGWAGKDIVASPVFPPRIDMRAANGASLGLQVPYLRGDEEGQLQNLCADGDLVRFRLPGDLPRIWTDGREGKLNETKPVIHTVIIEPDESRISIVWRGNAPALRPYMKDELEKMPLRIDWSW